jgi:DNA polymerase
MDSGQYYQALEQLRWQVELGATECIMDAPVDRYALGPQTPARTKGDKDNAPAREARAPASPSLAPASAPQVDPVQEAKRAAASAGTLDDLKAAMAAFPHCELRKGARNLVFCDGRPDADIMIVGEAPGRDEDAAGKPFVGRAGQLLDKMLAAIDLSREETVYITNVLPWRPPQNREPKPEEIAMMKPFLARHIELAAPKVIVIVGNVSCHALLGQRGITRLRGNWTEVQGRPAIPMFHPAYLLRNPSRKPGSPKWLMWQDIQAVRAKLDEQQNS